VRVPSGRVNGAPVEEDGAPQDARGPVQELAERAAREKKKREQRALDATLKELRAKPKRGGPGR
jgi:hypothetical protein